MNKLNIDCLILIFDQADKNSLHSCLLVNKEWCSIAVPILWKNYSSFMNQWSESDKSEKEFFNTILSCLPSSSKQILFDNDIKLPSTIIPNPPLFNYISFCEFPSAVAIRKIIKVIFEEFNAGDPQKTLEQEIYKLFVNQRKCIKELRWETSQPLLSFPGASTCFSQLYSLNIDPNLVGSNALYEMAQICKDLNKLTIRNCSQDLPGLISLIDAQRNLKDVEIFSNRTKKGTCKELGKALARKGNTLDCLYLGLYSSNIILPSTLTSLINLKTLEIYSISYEHQQHLAISEFPDIEDICIDGLSCFKELTMLIEKTKGNILYVNVYGDSNDVKNTGMLIKAIANKCPKIKTLFTILDPKDFIHIKLLLLNCRYLEYIHFGSLDIYVDGNDDDDVGDELLDILTKFSPNSLTEIYISSGWKYSIDGFERFFESCRERTLHYFGFIIQYNNDYITDDHEAVIQRYIEEGVIITYDGYVG